MAGGETRPLSGAGLRITAFALALGTFMQVLDTTIANVSIPTISGNLGVAADQGTWVITLFAMANGVSVPLTGSYRVTVVVVPPLVKTQKSPAQMKASTTASATFSATCTATMPSTPW